MKKLLSVLASVCLCLTFGLAFVACGKTIAVEELTVEKNTLTVASGGNAELSYTVKPADGDLVFELLNEDKTKASKEEVFTYTVSEGTVNIQAKTAGTKILRIRAKSDENICADCKVTVNLPNGYTAYRKDNVKFAYPSSWSKYSAEGVEVAYIESNSGSNVNLSSETKNNVYFHASSDLLAKKIVDSYEAAGMTVSGMKCTTEKYADGKAVRIDYSYRISLIGSVTQVQLVRNSDSKTYILTITNASSSIVQAMQNEFLAW